MADTKWRDGPHADAIYAIRDAIAKAEDDAERIVDALASVEKLWGPAGVERLTEGNPKKGSEWAAELRKSAGDMRVTARMLMDLVVSNG